MIFTDHSKWNGLVNWKKCQDQGVEGDYFKATGTGNGGNYIDYQFENNKKNCPFQYTGNYHYFDYRGKSGADQCKFFLDTVGDYGTMRGILDVEDNYANWGVKLLDVIGVAMREQLAWVNQYKKECGYAPAMYLNTNLTCETQWVMAVMKYQYIYRNFLDCPLIVARYDEVKNPLVLANGKKSAWSDYAMWQFTSRGNGQLYGNEKGNDWIDLNRVNNLQALLKPGITIEDEPVVVPVELSDAEILSKLWDFHPELH